MFVLCNKNIIILKTSSSPVMNKYGTEMTCSWLVTLVARRDQYKFLRMFSYSFQRCMCWRSTLPNIIICQLYSILIQWQKLHIDWQRYPYRLIHNESVHRKYSHTYILRLFICFPIYKCAIIDELIRNDSEIGMMSGLQLFDFLVAVVGYVAINIARSDKFHLFTFKIRTSEIVCDIKGVLILVVAR